MSARPTTWVCAVCGRRGYDSAHIGDESCDMHAVRVYADTLAFDLGTGRVVTAEAVPPRLLEVLRGGTP